VGSYLSEETHLVDDQGVHQTVLAVNDPEADGFQGFLVPKHCIRRMGAVLSESLGALFASARDNSN
jgi:hypothetical protein